MAVPSTAGLAANPHEGQVAIPTGNAHVVGRLGARAMRWVEESTGRPIDDIYHGFVARAQAAARGDADVGAPFPVGIASAIIWAAVEHERRLQGLPGPEFTLDDVDQIIDSIGLDDTYNYALALLQLSLPFRKRSQEIERAAAEAGASNPLDELRRVAAGTGPSTSAPGSTPGSTSPTSGI